MQPHIPTAHSSQRAERGGGEGEEGEEEEMEGQFKAAKKGPWIKKPPVQAQTSSLKGKSPKEEDSFFTFSPRMTTMKACPSCHIQQSN